MAVRFPTINAAQEWATTHKKHIVVEIHGIYGPLWILDVYPSGRRQKFLDYKVGSKLHERWQKRLTPDDEFEDRHG